MRKNDFVSGVIIGAGLMYLLDPDRGGRRRALLRDQFVHGAHGLGEVGERIAGKTEDLRNRAYGAAAEARSRIRREDVDDAVLEARVRSALGRAVSNPGSIAVAVEEGRVTLSGPILAHEARELIATVTGVRGVRSVDNRLDSHTEAASEPGLQGAGR